MKNPNPGSCFCLFQTLLQFSVIDFFTTQSQRLERMSSFVNARSHVHVHIVSEQYVNVTCFFQIERD